MKITFDGLLRYALWGGILVTANANRKHSGLRTAWVPHLIGNTFALLLPELYRAADAALKLDERAQGNQAGALATLNGALHDLVLDNPRYVEYVAPPVLAYLLTYPPINIYKSAWANRQLFGFGLDSIPHAGTAFGLTRMTFDALRALKRHTPAHTRLTAPVDWAATHANLVSAGAVAAATAFYESGEYAIHVSELQAVHDDPTKIEMEWSLADTLQDIISNAVGWLLAVLTQ
jgi:hypothetical protein